MGEAKQDGSLNRALGIAITIVAISFVIYQTAAPFQLFVGPNNHQVIHLTFALVLLFLVSMRRTKAGRLGVTLAAIYLAMTLFFAVYTLPRIEWLEEYAGSLDFPLIVVAMGVMLTFLVLESARRAMGIVIPIVCIVFLVYAYVAQYLPSYLHGPPVSVERLFLRMGLGSLGTNGIFGPILGVSANMIFMLFVFAALLQTSGAIRFFMQVGRWAGNRMAGGAAMTSVISSALVGMVTGSPTGNVALTGSFTIPAMKKAGYAPYQAGAIEATASTGGPITPPVMATAAFVMASITGIPYIKICLMAAIPAILYYFCAGVYVQLQAMKLRDAGRLTLIAEKVDFKEMLWTAPLFFVPLLLLIILLVQGFSIAYSTVIVIASLVVLSVIRKETRPTLKQWVEGITQGAISGAGIAAILACVGIILGSVSFTVAIQKLPIALMSVSGGSIFLGAFLAGIASILLGMGVSTLVAYIMVVLVLAPALIPLGITIAQAHMFSLYLSNVGNVTPPVAYAALVGAKLAGASYMRTAHEATKIAMAAFIVPFLFLYAPGILLQPTPNPLPLEILLIVDAFIMFAAFQVMFCAQYFTLISLGERIVFGIIGVVIFLGYPFRSYTFAAVGLGAFALATLWQWRKKVAVARAAALRT